MDQEIEQLVVRLARENDWGFERIEGELLKLGYTISHETVGAILRRHGIPPAPRTRDVTELASFDDTLQGPVVGLRLFHRRNVSVREECLDKLLIVNQAHLRRIMREYVEFFNTARPHQGIDQQILVPKTGRRTYGPVRCRNVLGRIIHDYYRDAA
jgi:hypothetical protein